ncbi:MAG: hypothetical protein ACKVS6_10470 [Planctomycetota bacterium]
MNTPIQTRKSFAFLFRRSIQMARDHFIWLVAISILAYEWNQWITPELLEFTNLSTDKYREGIGFARQFAIDVVYGLSSSLMIIPMAWVLGSGIRNEPRSRESFVRLLKNCWPSALVLAVFMDVLWELFSRGVFYLNENWVYLEELNNDSAAFVTTDFDWNKLWNTIATSAFAVLNPIVSLLLLGTFGVAMALCPMGKSSSGKLLADSLRLTRNHRASVFVIFVIWFLLISVIGGLVGFLVYLILKVEFKNSDLALRPFYYLSIGLGGYLAAFTAVILDARNEFGNNGDSPR